MTKSNQLCNIFLYLIFVDNPLFWLFFVEAWNRVEFLPTKQSRRFLKNVSGSELRPRGRVESEKCP